MLLGATAFVQADYRPAVPPKPDMAPEPADGPSDAPPPARPLARSESSTATTSPVFPDLGVVRYRDPLQRRLLWLGVDGGGVYVPKTLGLFNRDVWTARVSGSWALSLAPGLTAGGRHGLAFYDATNVRLQIHEHQLDLSLPLLSHHPQARVRDRLALSVEFHRLDKNWIDGEEYSFGGFGDSVAAVGYGLLHTLSPQLELGWNLQARWVWVFLDTQRQLRASLRPMLKLGHGHALGLELLAFLVHRDADQFGNPLPRTSVHAQVGIEHTWLATSGLGSFASLRYFSGFMSGQSPMYEVREEAINADYGEAQLGLRSVW
ncbi:MAG: hypothetical protein OEZ06_01235 [Myxococcales bacterium]|nr:hypothetical protein [Myxococcales bacterium]